MSKKKSLFYNTKRHRTIGPGLESSDEPSQTIQGDSMSIQELIMREKQGQFMARHNAQYFDVDDIETINRFFSPSQLDFTDLDMLNANIADMQIAVQRAISKQQKHEQKSKEPTPSTEEPAGDVSAKDGDK